MASPASDTPPTIEALRQGVAPFVLADAMGLVLEVNPPFEAAYGWSQADLEGQSLSLILPEVFQMAHHLGFSRFQSTGQSQILAHPLRLRTVCRDGRDVVSEHFIVAERQRESWLFGATLTPLPDGTETDA
ncbi:MAG: PAS domain S-box protein [Cyanobium sp.]